MELVQLVLSHNEFESLPEDLGVLYELKLIDVSHNQLRHLPLDLFTISELRSIDISHNKFTELPDEMSRLSTLVSLSCASNQLTELPLEFGSMAYQLTKLEASDNALKTLPMALKNAYSLSLLNLEKNRIGENRRWRIRPCLSCGCGVGREVPRWHLSWNGRPDGIESRQQSVDRIAEGTAALDESKDSQSQVSRHSSAASSTSVLDTGTII